MASTPVSKNSNRLYLAVVVAQDIAIAHYVSVDPLRVRLRFLCPVKFNLGELFGREMFSFSFSPAFTSNGILFRLPDINSV
jgi:hypothetical protein